MSSIEIPNYNNLKITPLKVISNCISLTCNNYYYNVYYGVFIQKNKYF